jgi:hypothetical protein
MCPALSTGLRKNTRMPPAVIIVSASPRPQHPPSHAAFALPRSPVTSVDTAAR